MVELERKDQQIIIATDLEGPHLLGDTALETCKTFVRPIDERKFNNVDYGGKIYEAIYEWFEEGFDQKGLGQDGSDIILSLPFLILNGVSEKELQEKAYESKRTPGSAEFIRYLKKQNAVVTGVTTAWREPHKQIVIDQIGMDQIFGTDFPLDQAKEKLIHSGRYEEEIELSNKFLTSFFEIIDYREKATRKEKGILNKRLREEIDLFYKGELGIVWNIMGEMCSVNGKGFKTQLGKIMAGLDVIGYKRKAEVAKNLFSSQDNAINIAIGDGANDCKMLSESDWSIGVNGYKAARAAKIGVVTQSMAMLCQLTDIIKESPDFSSGSCEKVVWEAQKNINGKAMIHLGGQDISQELVEKHRKMKEKLRGEAATFA